MYKKITHHIVEEHFDHPIATELKAKIEKKAKATIDYMGRVIDPLTGKPAIDPRTGNLFMLIRISVNLNLTLTKNLLQRIKVGSKSTITHR
jgi:16S rRNA C1402 N4-methylase RsmH